MIKILEFKKDLFFVLGFLACIIASDQAHIGLKFSLKWSTYSA